MLQRINNRLPIRSTESRATLKIKELRRQNHLLERNRIIVESKKNPITMSTRDRLLLEAVQKSLECSRIYKLIKNGASVNCISAKGQLHWDKLWQMEMFII